MQRKECSINLRCCGKIKHKMRWIICISEMNRLFENVRMKYYKNNQTKKHLNLLLNLWKNHIKRTLKKKNSWHCLIMRNEWTKEISLEYYRLTVNLKWVALEYRWLFFFIRSSLVVNIEPRCICLLSMV